MSGLFLARKPSTTNIDLDLERILSIVSSSSSIAITSSLATDCEAETDHPVPKSMFDAISASSACFIRGSARLSFGELA